MDRSQIEEIRIEDYDYPLPDQRIARHPLAERDTCLLLVRDPQGGLSTRRFSDLPALLPPDSMLVYNNTRVINARLRFRKGSDGTGALIEIFCLEPDDPADYAVSFAATSSCSWNCLVGNSKRWKDGDLTQNVTVDGRSITLRATRQSKDGASSVVRFSWDCPEVTFSSIISALGEIPIPPYLNRSTEESDSRDYQTVYSRIDGSVAAPTAGLHFTPAVLRDIDLRGIPRRELTLHVGAGTFQPVKSDTIGEHTMHSEFIALDRPPHRRAIPRVTPDNSRRHHIRAHPRKPLPPRMHAPQRHGRIDAPPVVPLQRLPPLAIRSRLNGSHTPPPRRHRTKHIHSLHTPDDSTRLQIPHSPRHGHQLPSATLHTPPARLSIPRCRCRRMAAHLRLRPCRRLPLPLLRRRMPVHLGTVITPLNLILSLK